MTQAWTAAEVTCAACGAVRRNAVVDFKRMVSGHPYVICVGCPDPHEASRRKARQWTRTGRELRMGIGPSGRADGQPA